MLDSAVLVTLYMEDWLSENMALDLCIVCVQTQSV